MAESPASCRSCGRPLPEGAGECPFCSAPTLDLQVPLPSISGYRVLQLLGEGGMGAVYLAEDEALGRRVAIKVVSERFATDTEARARFLREARSMATVEHAHIVRVYSFGELEGRGFLVMEFVEGEVLADRIRRLGKLRIEEALQILRQIVEALEAAWEKQIVHRDIKPSNILLDKRSRVRVADFGLAKPFRMEGDPTLSQKGYILGTPYYISPEQVRGQPADFRGDIYSLGIVLYEMLTGDRPFAGTTPLDVVDKQLHEPLPRLKDKRPDAPEGLERLLASMTQKDPASRPASYQNILESIDDFLGRIPAEAVRVEAAPRAGAGALSLDRVGVAALVLVVLATAWLAWKSLTPTPQAPTPAAGTQLVVGVTPFYGPDEDSAKEGRVMAAMVENEITKRLGKDNAKVLGIEETKQPVRDHEAARALGERLGASVVVWGQAFALRGETEIQPYFTLVPPKLVASEKEEEPGPPRISLMQDPLGAMQERAAKSLVVRAAAPNQIELHKTSAAGVGDMVLFLAGLHALYTERNAEKALALFTQGPPTAENLRYRAQALLELNRPQSKEQAIAVLQEAVALDPRDAQGQAQLADLHMEAGRFKEAVSAYRAASEAGGAYTTQRAIFYDGKLYAKETVRRLAERTDYTQGQEVDTAYLLALDPSTGNVVERYRLPGVPRSFTLRNNAIHIVHGQDANDPVEGTIAFSHGKFDRPVYYGGNLLLRRQAMWGGWALAANFLDNPNGKFALRTDKPPEDAPRTLEVLEGALRAAIAKDPTQPWHLFFLGQALWAKGQKDEAAKTWQRMFEGKFPATPYYEFAWMASYFEKFGQREWADKAYEEALKRRKQLPQPIEFASLFERLINLPFMVRGIEAALKPTGLERAHLWLERIREISGFGEGDDFAAAAWEKYFRQSGETEKARREAAYFEKAQRHPLNWSGINAKLDYALYPCVATMVGDLLLMVLLLARTAKQHAPQGDSALQGRVWLKLARLYQQVLRLPRWALTGLIAASASLAVLESISFLLEESPWKLFLTIAALLLALTVLFRSKITTVPYLISSVTPQARWLVAAAFLSVLIAVIPVATSTLRLVKLASTEFGFMDSVGHPRFVRQVEGRFKENQTIETRYVAAVVNHMAGNTDRARELYRALPQDARAQKNLAALEKGELVPPTRSREKTFTERMALLPGRDGSSSYPNQE